MFKLATLAILAGLTTATTILPTQASITHVPGQNQREREPRDPREDDECAYQLNYLSRVSRATIEAINGQRVHLAPVCEDDVRGHTDTYDWLFTLGNASTLRQPIGRNATLMRALKREGYDHQDVVSVRFGGDNTITLYVHQRYVR